MTRSTARAGALQAGDIIAGDADTSLLDLLNFDTVAAGVRVGDLLRERLTVVEAKATAHAAHAEDAALAGEVEERAHADEAGRLEREARRIHLAIERADVRLAEVADAERKAAARVRVAKAAKAAARAEAVASNEYPAAARAVADLLSELADLQADVLAARDAAREAGIGEEAGGLLLPHERRFQPEIIEEREVVTTQPAAGVYQGGRRIGNLDGPDTVEHRSIERVIVQRRHAPPNILKALAVLPDPDGGAILDRNRD